MDLAIAWCGPVDLVASIYLVTLLADIARLGPDLTVFRFDAEAGGARALGELRLELDAPGFLAKLYGSLQYTAAGSWNRYRGLLLHREAGEA
jgi:hypothetical protein